MDIIQSDMEDLLTFRIATHRLKDIVYQEL